MNYWKFAKWSLIVLVAILALGMITKIRMFFILLDLLAVLVAIFLGVLILFDAKTTLQPKKETSKSSKAKKSSKTFSPPKL